MVQSDYCNRKIVSWNLDALCSKAMPGVVGKINFNKFGFFFLRYTLNPCMRSIRKPTLEGIDTTFDKTSPLPENLFLSRSCKINQNSEYIYLVDS